MQVHPLASLPLHSPVGCYAGLQLPVLHLPSQPLKMHLQPDSLCWASAEASPYMMGATVMLACSTCLDVAFISFLSSMAHCLHHTRNVDRQFMRTVLNRIGRLSVVVAWPQSLQIFRSVYPIDPWYEKYLHSTHFSRGRFGDFLGEDGFLMGL